MFPTHQVYPVSTSAVQCAPVALMNPADAGWSGERPLPCLWVVGEVVVVCCIGGHRSAL